MFQKTHDLLKRYGLDDEDIRMVESGEVEWDILGNNDLTLLHRDWGQRHQRVLTDDQINELLNAHRFESRKRDHGIDSVTFVPGEIDDWAGITPDSDWEGFVKGYANAANALHRSVRVDSIEPYLFLCRHTLELTLKGVILLGQESLGLAQDLPDHHDLCRLWTAAYPILRDKLSNEESDFIRSVVDEYHSMDPGSFSFRYPVSRKNRKINLDSRLQSFSLKEHNTTFRKVVDRLGGIIMILKLNILFSGALRNSPQHGD
ncbi:hypothetical protein ACFL34_00505 [Candidatus Sumerlaeota bacterium]